MTNLRVVYTNLTFMRENFAQSLESQKKTCIGEKTVLKGKFSLQTGYNNKNVFATENNMKRKNLYLVMILLALVSCNKDEILVLETKIHNSSNNKVISTIPFADDETLIEIAKNKYYVSYQTARKLALIQMESSLKSTMDWNGTRLSEKPVLIYDGNSKPKYYEFIVQNESGIGIGTVTAGVQKETNASISHVLPYVRDYSYLTTKGTNYKIINGGYPNRLLLGVIGKSGETPSAVIDPETGINTSFLVADDAQSSIDALYKLSIEDLKRMEISNLDSMVQSIRAKDELNKLLADEYWSTIDTLSSALASMTDEEIYAKLNSSKAKWNWTSVDSCVLNSYNKTNMKRTRWSGWCGPSAIAWIYRGLYTSYKGTYLPLVGDIGFNSYPDRWSTYSNYGYYRFVGKGDHDGDGKQNDLDKQWIDSISNLSDGGLYAKIADFSGLYAWSGLTGWISEDNQQGPTLPIALGLALSVVTDAHYFVYPAFNFLSTDVPGHKHIRENQLPIICLINGFSHYIVAFGSKYEYWNWEVIIRLFGKNITLTKGRVLQDKWLLVHDNGATTSSYNYAPYWRNDNFFSFDLQYGVYKLY